ncbi:hypothetical protein [Actinomadura sp. 3N508]|uniref:Rv1733c family protein n=1 Tax=Actinomadura sp. 3N508 TaxID=3375153 RepID=UPI0037A71712
MNRWRRRSGFDRNDLRRPVDRIQWLSGLFLLVVFLVAAPLICVRAVQHAHDVGVRAERYEAVTRHRVDATVVKVKTRRHGREITVVWNDRDGTPRTGRYIGWRGAEVGANPEVWAGPRNQVSDMPPRTHARTVGDMAATGAAAGFATGLVPLGLYLLLRRRLDRVRRLNWDKDWAGFDRLRHRRA